MSWLFYVIETLAIIVTTKHFSPYIIQTSTKTCILTVGSGGRMVDRQTVNQGDGGSILPTAVSKLRQFHLPHICLCLLEETLKAGGPFYLVYMPGEVKDPTQGVNV